MPLVVKKNTIHILNHQLKNNLLLFITFLIIGACNNNKNKPVAGNAAPAPVSPAVPVFNADSAYSFVKAQCDFGTRVTNSKGHDACGNYLADKLRSYTPDVIIQTGTV